MRLVLFCCFAILQPLTMAAQWASVQVPSKANFYAVDARTEAVWIAGEDGTVLRSTDGGTNWTACAVPKGAEHASFRSIQGMDAETAVVLSTGKGSKLYRTADGCKSWKAVVPDQTYAPEFVALRRVTSKQLYVLTEPNHGKFVLYLSQDGGNEWFITDDPGLDAAQGESAAGTTMLAQGPFLYFGTGGGAPPAIHSTQPKCATPDSCTVAWTKADLGSLGATAGAHVLSVAVQMQTSMSGKSSSRVLAVGGTGEMAFAVYSPDGEHWLASQTRGARVAVGLESGTQTAIAVGASGTDISRDYGKTWVAPKPGVGAEGTGWDAMSLPFVVGTNGQVGKLMPDALKR